MTGLIPEELRIHVPEVGKLNVCARQCGKCLFGPDPYITWEPFGRELAEAALEKGSHFLCHKYKNVMCRGFFNRFGGGLWYVHWADQVGAINYIKSEVP